MYCLLLHRSQYKKEKWTRRWKRYETMQKVSKLTCQVRFTSGPAAQTMKQFISLRLVCRSNSMLRVVKYCTICKRYFLWCHKQERYSIRIALIWENRWLVMVSQIQRAIPSLQRTIVTLSYCRMCTRYVKISPISKHHFFFVQNPKNATRVAHEWCTNYCWTKQSIPEMNSKNKEKFRIRYHLKCRSTFRWS